MNDPIHPAQTVFATREAQELATIMLAQGLIAVALQGGRNHDHAMDGLLSAYATLADNNRCCTALCGNVLMLLGQQLVDLAASRQATRH